MGLEASVQFEDDPRIAADGEFEAELVEQADNETESADSEREDDALATRREELSVQRTLDATQMYLSEIGFSPLLSAEEERHFARLALKGDAAGRKRMIESNSAPGGQDFTPLSQSRIVVARPDRGRQSRI